ncbi:MAG: hypothetical protein ACI9MF_002246, partial [Gammaproteobacteria bacterium]
VFSRNYGLTGKASNKTPSFPHAFGGEVVHGSTVYGPKDGNPVKQLIQFISYQHLHDGYSIILIHRFLWISIL